MIGDNAPPLDDWQAPPPKCCGEFCLDLACPVCGMNVPSNVTLGSN